MKSALSHQVNKTRQLFISAMIVSGVAVLCYNFSAYIGYRVVALLLLATVSFMAMFLDIVPVLVSALMSALIWNFFFIPPKFTLNIYNPEDILMFFMYFVIALVHGVLTFKIRQMAKKAMFKEEKERTLHLYNTVLNSLSHEFRTPITVITSATENLQQSDKLSEEDKRALISEISNASSRLNHQVENLLSMSRLESGFISLKKDWTDINELIYGVSREFEENRTHEIKIHIDPDIPLFKIDRSLMEHVLHNVLKNALQYTPDGSIVLITAGSENDMLLISIEDNGTGFPEDEIEKVFEKFYRLNGTKSGGTGLGLAIAKGFTEAHEGKISLKNIETGGSRFTITIPAETSYLNNLKNE